MQDIDTPFNLEGGSVNPNDLKRMLVDVIACPSIKVHMLEDEIKKKTIKKMI